MSSRFTVVVPTRNRPDALQRAVRSVLDQSGPDDEVVVADDGSVPPVEPVGVLADDRVSVVRTSGDGPSAARNAGADHARGEWLAFLDDDDLALPGWLDAFRRAFGDTDAATVFVGIEEENVRTGARRVVLPEPSRSFFAGREMSAMAGTFATRRSTFESAGGYDPQLRQGENTELVIRLCRRGPSTAVHRPLVRRLYDPRTSKSRSLEVRYHAAVVTYERHADLLTRGGRSRYLVMRGVAAARAGHLPAARSDFGRAVLFLPWSVRAWSRLVVSLVPPLATRIWVTPSTPLARLQATTRWVRRRWRAGR